MIETILKYTFMQNALLAAILSSILCGVIGTIIVEKKLVSMSGELPMLLLVALDWAIC